MKRSESSADFRSALLVSLLIHASLLLLFMGLSGILVLDQPATQIEWVWSALQPVETPQAMAQPVAAESAEVVGAATTVSTSPAPSTAVPTSPQTNVAISDTPTSTPRSTTPQVSPAQSAASTEPSADLPSGSGFAIVPPRLMEKPPATLPPQIAQAATTGEVLLQVEVLADGRVGSSRVLHSSGTKSLDERAQQYVASWIFQPAWQPQTNKPVRVLTSVWVRYGKQKE